MAPVGSEGGRNRAWAGAPLKSTGICRPFPLCDLGLFSPAEQAVGTLRKAALLLCPGPQPTVLPAALPKRPHVHVGAWHEQPRVAWPGHAQARPAVLPAGAHHTAEKPRLRRVGAPSPCWFCAGAGGPRTVRGRIAALGNSQSGGGQGARGLEQNGPQDFWKRDSREAGVRAGEMGRGRGAEQRA